MERVARTFITYALLLLTLALISDAMPAVAQQTDATDAFDAYILQQMKEKRIPGATVVVAHRGKIVKESGYGFANLEWEARARPARCEAHRKQAVLGAIRCATEGDPGIGGQELLPAQERFEASLTAFQKR